MTAELEADMLTLKEVPRVLIPGGHHTEGTGFEGHGFFEASSIRKVGSRYYFVYSSHKSHELCYAVSDFPDRGFVYGGTLVSNGDIGLDGRTEPVNVLGNNHGGMVKAGGQWYIFYHRQTNGTEFSRQGCAEKLTIKEDGSIDQTEITSCGLNDGPLKTEGKYPAAIACHITDPSTVSVINYQNPVMQSQTRITATEDGQEQFITDIQDGSVAGYKYFDFDNVKSVCLNLTGCFCGKVTLFTSLEKDSIIGTAEITENGSICVPVTVENGCHALYFSFTGEGRGQFFSFEFIS